MRDDRRFPERASTAAHTDRLRAGLTGLGLVVVVVILTATNLRSAVTSNQPAPGGEALAVLGVAPNSETSAEAGNGTTPRAERPRR